MATLTYTGQLVITNCWCGMKQAIPRDLYDFAERTGKAVWCPLGHEWVFGDTVKKDLARTKELLEQERRRLQATRDLLAQEERSHAASRGHLTRQRKKLEKVVAGVCPVDGCKRHFADLRKHISTKHPAYRGEVGTSQHK